MAVTLPSMMGRAVALGIALMAQMQPTQTWANISYPSNNKSLTTYFFDNIQQVCMASKRVNLITVCIRFSGKLHLVANTTGITECVLTA